MPKPSTIMNKSDIVAALTAEITRLGAEIKPLWEAREKLLGKAGAAAVSASLPFDASYESQTKPERRGRPKGGKNKPRVKPVASVTSATASVPAKRIGKVLTPEGRAALSRNMKQRWAAKKQAAVPAAAAAAQHAAFDSNQSQPQPPAELMQGGIVETISNRMDSMSDALQSELMNAG